jgi:predicted metal-dependent phosphoesterase TrpH
MFRCGLGDTAWRIADRIDAVEVFNAQNMVPGPDRKAEEFATQHGLCKYVGSDSHSTASIAPAFQMMPDFDTHAQFLESLRAARFHTQRHPISYFAGAGYRTARHLLGLHPPQAFGAHHAPADDGAGRAVAVPAA